MSKKTMTGVQGLSSLQVVRRKVNRSPARAISFLPSLSIKTSFSLGTLEHLLHFSLEAPIQRKQQP